jgi:BirA family transcriptional regulator, biotin operon repressor / biotin---[acetyl-CoA-carboxylase] ligase
MADALRPETVEPLLRGRFGRPYLYRDSCESTQRLLDRSLGEGAVAVCDEQVAGRGRLGRTWSAPPGSALLCSVLLEPPRAREIAQLSLVGGLAVAEAVERAVSAGAGIKWPNDVLLGGRKVAGVLAEAAGGAVVLGIGLNVNQAKEELPEDARVEPASLFTVDGRRRERAPLLADLLRTLESLYDRWRDGGLAAVHADLDARDVLRGRRVSLDGKAGVAAGIDGAGRLVVEIDGELRPVESGEIRLVP